MRINLNVQGCSIVAAPMHTPSRTSLLLPLLLSHNSPHRPRLVVSRSTCPPISPPPPSKQLCTRSCSNKHTRLKRFCISQEQQNALLGQHQKYSWKNRVVQMCYRHQGCCAFWRILRAFAGQSKVPTPEQLDKSEFQLKKNYTCAKVGQHTGTYDPTLYRYSET